MWNCTHFRHSTDEQLRQVRIFFSTGYNLQSVHFELIRAFFPNHFSMSTRKVLHIYLTLTFPIFEASLKDLNFQLWGPALWATLSVLTQIYPRGTRHYGIVKHENCLCCTLSDNGRRQCCVVWSFVAARLLDQSLKGTIIRKFNRPSALSVASVMNTRSIMSGRNVTISNKGAILRQTINKPGLNETNQKSISSTFHGKTKCGHLESLSTYAFLLKWKHQRAILSWAF